MLSGFGLIPAHAGSTAFIVQSILAARAHPRSRGEHFRREWLVVVRMGSSPLTRGAPPPGPPAIELMGLIPAHAGSTVIGGGIVDGWGAHPRSRGEHVHPSGRACPRWGSSPLTRGAPSVNSWYEPDWGLIPAHAGSTLCRMRCSWRTWAHPRSRGEHWYCWCCCEVHEGLIPAHAGSTTKVAEFCCVPGAHPRSRGEHALGLSMTSKTLGSSPLTRGAPEADRAKRATDGAHPRSRGEHWTVRATRLTRTGSSPLTRGALW